MRRLLVLLLAVGLPGCEEPYYGDVSVAQYRPDDPRVVGPNAYQLRPAPYGVASPRPVFELRSPMGVVQRQWQDWNTPAPPASPPPPAPPAMAQPVAVQAAPLLATPSPAMGGMPPVAGPLPLDGPGQPLVVPGSLQPPLPGIPGQPAPPPGTTTLELRPPPGTMSFESLPPLSAPSF